MVAEGNFTTHRERTLHLIKDYCTDNDLDDVCIDELVAYMFKTSKVFIASPQKKCDIPPSCTIIFQNKSGKQNEESLVRSRLVPIFTELIKSNLLVRLTPKDSREIKCRLTRDWYTDVEPAQSPYDDSPLHENEIRAAYESIILLSRDMLDTYHYEMSEREAAHKYAMGAAYQTIENYGALAMERSKVISVGEQRVALERESVDAPPSLLENRCGIDAQYQKLLGDHCRTREKKLRRSLSHLNRARKDIVYGRVQSIHEMEEEYVRLHRRLTDLLVAESKSTN